MMRAALYARVSTTQQDNENQFQELRRYAEARGWAATEYADYGVSGAKERRPALDRLLADARRRRFDAVVVWRLDRAGRSLRHLIGLVEELSALGIAFISLGESIDLSTPAGKLQFQILSSLAEFERGRIRERVMAGLARAKSKGVRLGRPEARIPHDKVSETRHLTINEAAAALGVSRSTLKRWRRRGQQSLSPRPTLSPLSSSVS